MSKARRWEKSTPAPAAQNQSPMGVVTSFVDSLNESERASHRAAYLHLMQALTGSHVSVDGVDGIKLSGVLHTVTPFDSKHVVVIKSSKVEGDTSAAPGTHDGMTIMKDFSSVVSLQNTSKLDLVSRTYSTEFATDSSIKKHGDMSHLAGRNLKSVDKSWLEASGDMSLEGKSTSGKSWDQFEANRRLFNVKDTYDENLYTKRLDLKSMTAEQIANADRLAREIEGTASSNIHLQEERGQATQGDWDEEDRFSGVLRGNEGTAAARKTTAPVDNPWKRNTKLNLSGSASPATPSSTSSAKQSLAPPPGVPAPSSAPAATTKKAAPVEVAPVVTKETTEKPAAVDKVPEKVVEEKKPESEPVAEIGVPSTETPAASTTTTPATTTPAAEPATVPEVKPTKKLNAAAAEFKPSWLTASTPATPAAAPSTPMSMPQSFQQYPPNNIHYNAPSTPDMYNKQPPLMNHNSPNFVPPPMHMMQPESPYGTFDPNVPYLPPQPFIPNQPMGYEGQYFMPPQQGMIIPPQMTQMDYIPNQQMMMPMMMPYGQQVPMPGHEMYTMPPPQMAFQQGNGNMYSPGPAPQPQMHMYGSPQQPQQGGYNNMGSGQKPKYDNNMRNNNMNKGGRGMGGRGGYNNNNNGGRGFNSPQQHGMAGPANPAPANSSAVNDAPPAEGSA